jgi:hypothetical protein
MMPYDEEHEIAKYVWRHYGDLFTAAEKRAYMPYLWERMKVEKGRDVVEFEWKQNRIAEDAEVMALLADGVEAFHRRAAQRVLREHGSRVFLNRCRRCGRLVRTPLARQCLWCGYDWHQG